MKNILKLRWIKLRIFPLNPTTMKPYGHLTLIWGLTFILLIVSCIKDPKSENEHNEEDKTIINPDNQNMGPSGDSCLLSLDFKVKSRDNKDTTHTTYFKCNELILHEKMVHYDEWRDKLTLEGFVLEKTCPCEQGLQLWMGDVAQTIGSIKDAPSDAGKIGEYASFNYIIEGLQPQGFDLRVDRYDLFSVAPPESFCTPNNEVKVAIVDSRN